MAHDVITVTLNAEVADSAAFFAPYPDNRNAQMYAVDGHYVRSNRYGTQHDGEDATFVFGLDGVTITNQSGEAFAIGTTLFVNIVFAEAEEGDTTTGPPTDVGPQLDALRQDFADTSGAAGKGALGIGYANDGSKLDGAETVQEGLDNADAIFLKAAAAQDAIEANRFVGGDRLFGVTTDGQVIIVDYENLADPPQTGSYDILETPFTILPEHAGRLGVNRVAGNAVAQFALQSAQEYLPGSEFQFLHRGGGTFGLSCADASIQINEAADGSVEAAARGDMLTATNVGVDDWSATGKPVTTTTDTTPPAIESISPPPGTTILPGTSIVLTMTESVKAGAGDFTQRQNSGGGFGDDGTIAAASLSISGRTITLPPATAHVPGDTYAWQAAAGVVTDVSAAENAFAGVADDATIGPWTIAVAAPAGIRVVDSQGFRINAGPVSPPDVVKTMNATPATGDMVIQFAVAPVAITAGPPDGMSNFYDSTSANNPGSYAVHRTEGGTPSNELSYPAIYNWRQAAGYLVVRGSGGTLATSSGEFKAGSTAVAAANPDPYTPLTDNELVLAVYTIDSQDLAPSGAALLSAGWKIAINQNTEQGSTTQGCTLVVAYKEDCPVGVPVDPPALEGGNVIYRSWTLGVKET